MRTTLETQQAYEDMAAILAQGFALYTQDELEETLAIEGERKAERDYLRFLEDGGQYGWMETDRQEQMERQRGCW